MDIEECGMVPSLPLFIKGRGRGSAAPLDQSGHRGRRESGPTRCPNRRRPGFPPPPPATCMRDMWRASRIEGTGEATVPHPVTVGATPTARAQVKGYKSAPLLLYTDRSPQAWATHKRDTLLGQAQNGARARGADFTAVILRLLRFPMTRVECATWRGARDVGGMRGAVSARMRHIMVKRWLAPSP